jgi:hypothetical protein
MGDGKRLIIGFSGALQGLEGEAMRKWEVISE